jgi:hypothetical protein
MFIMKRVFNFPRLFLLGFAGVSLLLFFGISTESILFVSPFFCGFKLLTSIPCPGCGMTHALLALAGGNVTQAVAFNPFSLPLLIGMILASLRVPFNQRYLASGVLFLVGFWWIGTRLIPHLI